MARIPRRYATLLYGILQAGATTAAATGVAAFHMTASGVQLVEQWAITWLLAWLTTLPLVVGISPLIRRMVEMLTSAEDAGRPQR
jgi:hypothetical protein